MEILSFRRLSRWRRPFGACVVLAGLLVAFQNCQKLELSSAFVASSFWAGEDARTLRELQLSSTYVAAYVPSSVADVAASGLKNLRASSLSDGLRFDLSWTDAAKAATPSAQGLLDQSFARGEILESSFAEPLMTDVVSMVLRVRQPISGDLIMVHDGSRFSESFGLAVDAGVIYAVRLTDGQNYVSLAADENASAGQDLVIAASFGKAADQVRLMVNGVLSKAVPVKSGLPADARYLQRKIGIGSTVTNGRVIWGEAQIYLKELTPYELGVVSRDIAARHGVDGVIDDPALRVPIGPGDGGEPENPLFEPVAAIISSRCLSCHQEWSGRKSDDFVASGLIVPGSPEGSKLYYRLIGSSGSSGPKTMPSSGSALPSSSLDAIKAWIQSE